MGAEAILELLHNVNLEEEVAKLKEELATTTSQKAARLIKRIEVMDAFIAAGTKPEWMILTEIPVIPPDLRPRLTNSLITNGLNNSIAISLGRPH